MSERSFENRLRAVRSKSAAVALAGTLSSADVVELGNTIELSEDLNMIMRALTVVATCTDGNNLQSLLEADHQTLEQIVYAAQKVPSKFKKKSVARAVLLALHPLFQNWHISKMATSDSEEKIAEILNQIPSNWTVTRDAGLDILDWLADKGKTADEVVRDKVQL